MSFIMDAWGQVAEAVVNKQPGLDEPANDLQVYLIIIQGLWAIILLMVGFFVRQLNVTLRDMMLKYEKLHERLLTDYATKQEVIDRVHGLRDAMGVHSTWIHLLAHVVKMDLPHLQQNDKDKL